MVSAFDGLYKEIEEWVPRDEEIAEFAASPALKPRELLPYINSTTNHDQIYVRVVDPTNGGTVIERGRIVHVGRAHDGGVYLVVTY